MFCTYLTVYSGNLFPKRYIGSTSVEKIQKGYHGSVASEDYKDLWEQELRDNPFLFKTRILTTHSDREEATQKELEIQKKYDVVIDEDYVNKSFAQPNGFFGRDVSGNKNPMHGKSRKGEKHKGGENISAALKETYANTEWGEKKKEQASKLMKENNPTSDPETMKKIKETWKKNKRGVGEKNGMFGKTGAMKGKKLYNNGSITKSFFEGDVPEGWEKGRHTFSKSNK